MESQIRNHVRLTLVKLRQFNKYNTPEAMEIRKIAGMTDNIDIVVMKLFDLEPKNDYQHLVLMTLLNELISTLHYNHDHSGLNVKIQSAIVYGMKLLDYAVTVQSIQAFFQLKKMEILRVLLLHKMKNCQLQFFMNVYKQLKSCQKAVTAQHSKIVYLSTHKQIIEECQDQLILEFVIGEIFDDCRMALQNSSQKQYEWMRTMDTRMLIIQHLLNHRKLRPIYLSKIAFLLIKSSVNNLYLQMLSLGIAQSLLLVLLESKSPLSYIVVTHTLVNPLNKQLNNTDDPMLVELLMSQIVQIFKNRKLLFHLLKIADVNIHSKSLIDELVSSLYDYLEKQEKKQTKSAACEIVKKSMKSVMEQVKEILQHRTDRHISPELQAKLTVYRLKQKQYQELCNNFNKNKKIVQLAGQNEHQHDQFIRFLKRSPHINAQKMNEVLGLQTKLSASLRKKYVESFKLDGYGVQQSVRIMLSNLFLIGQSQQINRVLDDMTEHITKSQKDRDWTSVHQQATAIIFLNTVMHNPMAQRKISETEWTKMLQGIKGLLEHEAADIYNSITKSKIENFRDLGNLYNINLQSFLYSFYSDNRFWSMSYIDPDLAQFEQCPQLLKHLSYEILEGVLVGKEVDKMLKQVDTFIYKDDVYECQILETLKVLVARGKIDTPIQAFTAANKYVNFSSDDIDEKYLSYYWLCAKILSQQLDRFSAQDICDFLIKTCKTRKHLQDDVYCLVQLKVKRIKESSKEYKGRMLKKKGSLLDIFSNFLTDKQSSDEEFKPVRSSQLKKSFAFKKLSVQILDQLIASQKLKDSISYLVRYLSNPEHKVPVEHFIMILFLISTMVCQSGKPRSIEMIEQLFESILSQRQTSLASRMKQLKRRKEKKHDLITDVAQYLLIKMLIQEIEESNRFQQLVDSSIPFVEKCSVTLLQEFITSMKVLSDANRGRDKYLFENLNAAILRNTYEMGVGDPNIRQYAEHVMRRQQCRIVLDSLVQKVVVTADQWNLNKKMEKALNKQEEVVKSIKQQMGEQTEPLNEMPKETSENTAETVKATSQEEQTIIQQKKTEENPEPNAPPNQGTEQQKADQMPKPIPISPASDIPLPADPLPVTTIHPQLNQYTDKSQEQLLQAEKELIAKMLKENGDGDLLTLPLCML